MDTFGHCATVHTVQVSLDTSDVQHEKLGVRLVLPALQGFSVPPAPETDAEPEKELGQGAKEQRKEAKEQAVNGGKRTVEEEGGEAKRLKVTS